MVLDQGLMKGAYVYSLKAVLKAVFKYHLAGKHLCCTVATIAYATY